MTDAAARMVTQKRGFTLSRPPFKTLGERPAASTTTSAWNKLASGRSKSSAMGHPAAYATIGEVKKVFGKELGERSFTVVENESKETVQTTRTASMARRACLISASRMKNMPPLVSEKPRGSKPQSEGMLSLISLSAS